MFAFLNIGWHRVVMTVLESGRTIEIEIEIEIGIEVVRCSWPSVMSCRSIAIPIAIPIAMPIAISIPVASGFAAWLDHRSLLNRH